MLQKIKYAFKKFTNFVDDLVFPKNITCAMCRQDLFKESRVCLCDKCKLKLPFIDNPCSKCGKQCLDNKCILCSSTFHYFNKAVSVFDYTYPVNALVYRMKYKQEFYLAQTFAYYMYLRWVSLNWKIDCVLSVPMSKEKLKKQIHNHSALLANEFCKYTKLENISSCIIRTETETQTKLSRSERFENVQNSLQVVDKKVILKKNILIIDDIFTTGATSNAIAKTLLDYRANKVYVLTLCNVGNKQMYGKQLRG